jgi:fumarate hydratase subunit beta
MTKTFNIQAPLSDADVQQLRAGDTVLISGVVYTARDAAHKRIVETLDQGRAPFDLAGQIIYYVGPSPAPPGRVIGAAGPTTSYRMDPYAPTLIQRGLKAMIGKGKRDQEVKRALVEHKAVYLGAIGGAGALLGQAIQNAEVIAYEELGPEAVRRLEVVELPTVVVNDVHGADLYQDGRNQYAR